MRVGVYAGRATALRRVLIATATLALCAAPAARATRYASPTGKASASCATPAAACDLRTAVEGVAKNEPASGETVVVATGTYPITSSVKPGATNMRIEGEAGQPRPVLKGNTSELIRIENSGALDYLTIVEEGTFEGIFASGATLERLRVIGSPSGEMLCQCYNGLIRDSVFIARAGSTGGAVGLNSNGGTAKETLRNDTIYSESEAAPAVWLDEQKPSGSLAWTLINTIAVNAAGGQDLRASAQSTITVNHSAYRKGLAEAEGTIANAGGNVSSAPLFASAAEGDFRELTSSPTLDAGLTEAENGPLDYEGNPRSAGPGTDIGAFEYQPPVVAPPGGTVEPIKVPLPAAVAPVITGAGLSARVFRATARGRAFAAARRTPRGAVLSWRDSEAASTVVRLARIATGHLSGHRCLAGRPTGRRRPCKREVALSKLDHTDVAGANTLHLTGRLHNRKLPPGSYTLTLTPSAGGLTGAPVAVLFRLAP